VLFERVMALDHFRRLMQAERWGGQPEMEFDPAAEPPGTVVSLIASEVL